MQLTHTIFNNKGILIIITCEVRHMKCEISFTFYLNSNIQNCLLLAEVIY